MRTRDPRWVQDWLDAEIVECLEAIEAQIANLDVDRAQLETEFFKRIEAIEAQVENLDTERDWLELDLSLAQRQRLSASPIDQQEDDKKGESAEPTPLVHAPEAPTQWPTPLAPIHWPTLALLVTLVLGPWILIGAFVLTWLLVRS